MVIKETINDLLKYEGDIDVCDDYDESCYIAFCGPLELTEDGAKEFTDVLPRECEFYPDVVVLHADNDKEVERLRDFFYSAAGYCSEKDYEKWFKECD